MLTTKQAAELLGVTDSQVRYLIRDKKLKATKLGLRVWMIDERDLDAYRRAPQGKMGRPRKHMKAQEPGQ